MYKWWFSFKCKSCVQSKIVFMIQEEKKDYFQSINTEEYTNDYIIDQPVDKWSEVPCRRHINPRDLSEPCCFLWMHSSGIWIYQLLILSFVQFRWNIPNDYEILLLITWVLKHWAPLPVWDTNSIPYSGLLFSSEWHLTMINKDLFWLVTKAIWWFLFYQFSLNRQFVSSVWSRKGLNDAL